ncbi:uncharacterized protein [Dermacentor albipictus]|uniref:uncharacterized protein n=1 Tax=Dermacentor albipictus TaxID=60249 RepID=UPI0031FC30A9
MVDCQKPGCQGKLQSKGAMAVCSSCRSVNCLQCNAIHEGMSCKGYMRSISADVSPVQTSANRGAQKLHTQQYATPRPSTPAATPGPSHKKTVTRMAESAVTTENDSSEMLVTCKVTECEGVGCVDKDTVMFRCPICNHYTCVQCSAVHESMTCAQYQRNKDNVSVPVYKPPASPEEEDEDFDAQEEQPEANGDAEGMIVECRHEGCAGYAYVVKTATTAQCELCKHWTCVACKVCHESQTCAQYKGIDVPMETVAQPPVPSSRRTGKHKQENGADNSGGGFVSAARSKLSSWFGGKGADAQSEPGGAEAAWDDCSMNYRAAESPLYRDRKKVQENTCDVCNSSETVLVAEGCEHNLCRKCIRMAVEKRTVYEIVGCPAKVSYQQQQCTGVLKEHEYKDHVSRETLQNMRKKSNWFLAECFNKKCSTERKKISLRVRKGKDFYVCPHCGRRNCWTCRAVHDGMTCEQYVRKLVHDMDAGKLEDPREKEKRLLELVTAHEQDVVSTSQEFECAICVVEVEPGKGIILKNCHHKVCGECLANTAKNSPTAEVQCPCFDDQVPCQMTVFDSDLRACLSKDDYAALQDRSLREAENKSKEPAFHCKTPDCRGWCLHDRDVELFQCPVCGKENCLRCEAIHEGMKCAQYQEDLKIRAQNDAAAKASLNFLEEMLKTQQAMRCPQCRVVIIKRSGCDFMVCTSCQTQLCWATRGARWGPNGVGDISGGCRCGVGGVKCHLTCSTCH